MHGTPPLPEQMEARHRRFLQLADAELRRALAVPNPSLARHYGMMHYHMGWVDEALQPAQVNTGKRVRSLLCLETCAALGGDPERALPATAALELLHNFSLIHDDIEDDSEMRRGRTTVWTLWGVPQAINVGDGMFSVAHMAMEGLLARGVPAQQVLQAMRMFHETCVALTEGQFLDMDMETRLDVDLDLYLWMIRNKTAALLGSSVALGALLADQGVEMIAACRRFGEDVGMAFQIVDDILGTWGDEAVTGKSTSSDIRERKKTYMVALALERLTREPGSPAAALAGRLAQLYGQPILSEAEIREALGILEALNSRQQAEEAAAAYYDLAMGELRSVGLHQEAAPGLHWLAARLVRRSA
ncbi:MAG: polyprenyl synthetase family protein [Chloroflexi bacterium]|nr:polyprenyl synthetase family protein [Chloroflexota bacterium]